MSYLRSHHLARFALEILLILVITFAVFLTQQHPAQSQAGQQVGDITMLPSTVPIDPRVEKRAAELLKPKAQELGINKFVATDVMEKDGYYVISIAGLPNDLNPKWSLDQAKWLGTVTIVNPSLNKAMPGVVNDLSIPKAQSEDEFKSTGVGGSGNILPFRTGTTAVYGEVGVHACGFSLGGYKAVDLFPTENQIYASQGGQVSYVCRDGTQVALRIGEMLYDHLVDTGQQVGDSFTQGQSMGSLVKGTFDATCGYAAQNANAFHVHWCFLPSGGASFTADGYTLSTINGNWWKDGNSVAPTGTLTATWQDANVAPPGPTAGGNFWDGIASGVVGLFEKVVPGLPTHQTMGLADKVMGQAQAPMNLMYMLVFGIVDMTIPIFVFGIIMTLEAARLIYAAYMFVKKAIPVIG